MRKNAQKIKEVEGAHLCIWVRTRETVRKAAFYSAIQRLESSRLSHPARKASYMLAGHVAGANAATIRIHKKKRKVSAGTSLKMAVARLKVSLTFPGDAPARRQDALLRLPPG